MRARRWSIAVMLCMLAGYMMLPTLRAQQGQDEETKVRTPAEVSRDLVKQLRRGRMPWQFYQHYANYYYGIAARFRATITDRTTKVQQQRIMQQVAFWQRLGDMVTKLADHKKVADQISQNNSDVPFRERADTYKRALRDHDQLVDALVQQLQAAIKQRGSAPPPEGQQQ